MAVLLVEQKAVRLGAEQVASPVLEVQKVVQSVLPQAVLLEVQKVVRMVQILVAQ